ncbi:MAG: hypothetical protein HY458_02480 [Parcubacteria group bacterium]|nr:hypothetical protein [Parcubacteria group bacterium]
MLRKVKTLRFFFGEFHSGVINHTTHFVGFALLGYGLAQQSWGIIFLSACIMESGHVYNYAMGKYRDSTPKMFALGTVILLCFTAVAYFVTRFLP